LFEFSTWKATELRQFLLYTGPVVLLNNIPTIMYRNFLLLSVSMRILLSPALCSSDNCDYAEEILKLFVTDFAAIYGNEFVSYNIHSLIRLAQMASVSTHYHVTRNPSKRQIRDNMFVCILTLLEEMKETQKIQGRMLQTLLQQRGNISTTISSIPEGLPLKTVRMCKSWKKNW